MANQKVETPKSGCCGSVLSSLYWLTTVTAKLAVLGVLVALLVTVHLMKSAEEEAQLQLLKSQQELEAAVQQKEAAHRAYTDTMTQANQVQTDLANTRADLQKLQVIAARKDDLQRDLDRKTQEAKSAKLENLVLTQRLQEIEAVSRKELLDSSQEVQAKLEALQSEKAALQQSLSSQEEAAKQKTAELAAAAQKMEQMKAEYQQAIVKVSEAEKTKEMLTVKEKAQDKNIEELMETIKKLEAQKKAEHDQGAAELAATQQKMEQMKAEYQQAMVKVTQTERLKEMFTAKEKAQDRKIEELMETIRKLETVNKP